MTTTHRAFQIVDGRHLMGDAVAEIMFGIYPGQNAEDGATLAEMAFRWRQLGGRTTCRLEVFDESWAALSRMPDLLAALGGLVAEPDASRPWRVPTSPTVERVVEALTALGFEDRTGEAAR